MYRRVKLTILLFFVSVSLAGAFVVPDTGIVKCYDAGGNQIFPCPEPDQDLYGQDGNIVRNSMNYTDNGDTITDVVTKLVWQKTTGGPMNWEDAAGHHSEVPPVYDGYCDTLVLGAYDDWRLPVMVELDTLLDLSVESGAAINPLFTGAAAGYWTSTPDSDNSDNAWVLDFGTTEDGTDPKTNAHDVRCVRGGVI
jgi:hypothetical protein